MKNFTRVLGVGSAVCLMSLTVHAQVAPEAHTSVNALGQTITVTPASSFQVSPPLSEWPVYVQDDKRDHDGEQKAKGANRFRQNEIVNQNALPAGDDPVWQKTQGTRAMRAPEQNFNGLSGVQPPDPSGAAGPDAYVQAVNVSWRVFSKTGQPGAGPYSLSSLWAGSSNAGDPIVMYDRHADRWFISQFDFPDKQLIAVSETNDPTGSYYSWTFSLGSFPDYPKFSIWHDAYYMTSNSGNTAVAFDRSAMLNGDANAQMIRMTAPSLGTSGFRSVLPADADGDLPPAGTPCYFFNLEDDAWGGVNQDRIKVYEMTVDWVNTNNSNISVSQTLPTQAFDTNFGNGFSNIAQPGTSQKLDAVSGVLYYRAQYMRWVGYNSVVLCHVVDVNGSNRAGVRWYELRDNDDGVFSIYQQGTYAPGLTANRWMASIAMDNMGNIGLAYSYNDPNNTEFTGIRYTARTPSDNLGEMSAIEEEAVAGTGAQSGTNRYGDYAHMTLDPDGETLWYTGEYLFNGNQRTRIFSFKVSGTSVDVEENPYHANLNLQVIPQNGNLQVNINGLHDLEPMVLDVLSIDGKMVSHQDVTPSSAQYQTTLDLDLAAGTYLIRIGNEKWQEVEKVVIAR